MAIQIDQENKLITLHTEHTTYQMAVGVYGHLLHLYYGKRCEANMRYLLTFYNRGFSGNPYEAGRDQTYSMDLLPQEYSCFGVGDYRSCALAVEDAQGCSSVDLRYVSCRVEEGKYGIPGLPASYTEERDRAQTLIVHMEDQQSGVAADLYYGVFPDRDMIARSARIYNQGRETVVVKKAASLCVDFVTGGFDVIHFCGRYGTERIKERRRAIHGNMTLESRRGISSHQENPFFILADSETTETSGLCYGAGLLYSGNFQNEIEVDPYEQTRLVMGVSQEQFAYALKPGEAFLTPEAVISCTDEGLEALSFRFHRFVRENVCRGAYKTERRPVLINNWEATYFDFSGEVLLAIARQAAELGVELFVLDDGWFGHRSSDDSSLGDWYVNEEKLGGSLRSVAGRIRELGMKFGLWIEPEMISEDSDLYRRHPEYAFRIPGRSPERSRNQLCLDFSRKEVVDAIFDQISGVLDEVQADYLKIDMNRSLNDVYSAGIEKQNNGAILYRYVLGMYSFLERLKERYPRMLIEGCCGGGGRFDMGMLYYAPQIWCSDNTDAIERIKIQHGTSYGYPMSAIGAHVSAAPNHQTKRITPLRTRGAVAMTGGFGYELDLRRLSEEEKELVREQIRTYKRDWELIGKGRYFRLTDVSRPGPCAAWEYALEDGSRALLTVTALTSECNPAVPYVRLRGLREDAWYELEETGQRYPGSALIHAGIPVPNFMREEYDTWQVHFVCLE